MNMLHSSPETVLLKRDRTVASVVGYLVPLLLLCIFALFLQFHERLQFTLFFPDDGRVKIWGAPLLTIGIVVVLCAVAVAAFILSRKTSLAVESPLAHTLRPLLLLPFLLPIIFLKDVLSDFVVSNTLFYLPLLLFSLVLLRAGQRYGDRLTRRLSPRSILLCTLFSILFFGVGGWCFTQSMGEHRGDEGHYIIQAESLYEDGDLDIYNNFDSREKEMIDKGRWSYLHISPNSRDGHYYSHHPFGLSLLLAPVTPLGAAGRHIVLALLAGLGVAGMLLLCRLVGASTLATLLVTGMFTFSTYWTIYAFRVLPETAGAALTAWLGVGLLLRKRRQLLANCLVALTVFCLPWLHTRFIPLSLSGAALYGLLLLYDAKSIGRGIKPLAIFCIPVLLGYTVYAAVHLSMFDGGFAYPMKQLLFSYLPGLGKVFFSNKGLFAVLPLAAVMIVSMVLTLFSNEEHRVHICVFLLLFASVWATSCSTIYWFGGSTLGGRFLLVVSVLFIPYTALAFDKGGPLARWWMIFLGLIPCAFLYSLLSQLPVYDGFRDIRWETITNIPLLFDLVNPFSADSSLFGLIVLGASLAIVAGWPMRDRFTPLWAALVVGAAILFHVPDVPYVYDELSDNAKKANARRLQRVALDRAAFGVPTGASTKGLALDEVVQNELGFYSEETIAGVTTINDSAPQAQMYRQSQLPVNDWQQRGLRWLTMVPPFQMVSGNKLFTLKGSVQGGVDVVVAVVQFGSRGGTTLVEKKLVIDGAGYVDEKIFFAAPGKGTVHLVVRLENGAGQFRADQLGFYPVNSRFLDYFNLRY